MNQLAINKKYSTLDLDDTEKTSKKSAIDRDGLAFLWEYTKPQFGKLVVAFFTSLPIAAFGGIIAWSIKQATQSFATGDMHESMFLWLGLSIVFMILCSCIQIINTYVLSSLHAIIGNNIRIDLYDEIHQNSISFHSNIRTGELANFIGNDAQFAAGGVVEIYSAFWQRPCIILCLVGFMYYMNPLLSIVALTFFPLLSLCVIKLSYRVRKIESRYIENFGQLMGDMIESLTNIRQVKAFSQEANHRKTLVKKCNKLISFFKKVVLIKSFISPVTEIFSSIGLVAMAIIAYYQLQQGITTPGAIAGCLTAAISLKRVTKELSLSVVELQRSFAAIHRIYRLSGYTDKNRDLYSINEPVKTLALENVSFSYDLKKEIIQGANIEFHQGEHVAVIGPSGGGKTSLLDLIIGFYPCTSGKIKVNGRDLADINLKSWRNQIGIVTQDPFLFDMTIEQNIKYGNFYASPNQILTAVERTGCLEMINRLPDGIKTMVGERGCRLSGGERKRVALARALIRPISVILLDEATSELDPVVEEDILSVIGKLAKDMIIINVSHRPSIIRHSDRIILIKHGTINEFSPTDCEKILNTDIYF